MHYNQTSNETANGAAKKSLSSLEIITSDLQMLCQHYEELHNRLCNLNTKLVLAKSEEVTKEGNEQKLTPGLISDLYSCTHYLEHIRQQIDFQISCLEGHV